MTTLGLYRGGGVPRIYRQAALAERGAGAVAATRIQVVGMVSEIGLMTVAHLSDVEARLVRQAPLADARLAAIVNAATGGIAAQVARLALGE